MVTSSVLVKLIDTTMLHVLGTTQSWLQVQYLLNLTMHNVVCTRNYLIMTTGSVPIELPQIQLSSLEQTNTNTKWHADFVFAKSSQKHLFRLPINLHIQTKHHPVAISKWGGRKNPKSIHFYKHACTYIHYFCTCNKILIFTNGLRAFIADTFYCKFQWQSHGYRLHLLFHNLRISYSSSIIFDCGFDLSADHCCSCSAHL